MFLLIENGELFTPARSGRGSVLVGGGAILKVGDVDRRALDVIDPDYYVIDAGGHIIAPGFLDPHEHILGGSGEGGFSAQTPEIRAAEIARSGITTVVGTLGVDTTMKNMAGLLGHAKALRECGLTAFIWTGGYDVPPATLTGAVRTDLLFIEEVIGVGEIAIADERSMEPTIHELARIVCDAFIGGRLSGKAGLSHFHVGPSRRRLGVLRRLIDEHDLKPEWLYPTHISRTRELMDEAIALAKRGCPVDVDVTEQNLPKWLAYYREHGGPMDRLTASTDASFSAPRFLVEQVRACVHAGFELETVLPVVTTNPARVLKLGRRGRLERGADADVVVLSHDGLEVMHVIAGGRPVVADGASVIEDKGTAGARMNVPERSSAEAACESERNRPMP